MILHNKFEKTFGPFGSSTGFFMMIGGIATVYFSFIGLLIAFAGAFVAFTTTSTYIDEDTKRIRYSTDLFGLIPTGKWISLNPDMKVGLKKSHRGYQAYIMGTQPVSIHNNDVRIYLFDSANKPILPVKKFDSLKSAKSELDNLGTLLGLEII